jgi:hypothetical protein
VVCDTQAMAPSGSIAGLPRVIVPRLAAAETERRAADWYWRPRLARDTVPIIASLRLITESSVSFAVPLQDVALYLLSARIRNRRASVGVIVTVGTAVAESRHREARW